MDQLALIPAPDVIPAPAWIFLSLDLVFFALHILVINVVLGGSILLLWNRFVSNNPDQDSALAGKIPTSIALGVNFGVAPLLFMQVIYGHLFYTSSVLMATYWILVIPVIIIAYYSAYIHARKYTASAVMAKAAILVTVVFLLYIAFMQVNNMSLMTQPGKWGEYFTQRSGTILNVSDASFWPRYLHFVLASLAIAALFSALVWSIRGKKSKDPVEDKIKKGLKIFGLTSIVQVLIGFWWLMALPREFIVQFMGRNMLFSLVLLFGFLSAIGAIVSALRSKLRPTLIQLVITVLLMVVTRHNLRSLYLDGKFDLNSLQMSPQYGVMALFLVILVIGLVLVWYMLQALKEAQEGRVA